MNNFGPSVFTYPNLYRSMVERAADGALFVEVGCFYGRSTHYLANEIRQSGKKIRLHCVDLWGSVLDGNAFNGEAVYQQFLINMEEFKFNTTIHRGLSWDMADEFADGTCDFIFIDADHYYDSVVKDLRAWHPKLKVNGVLAGHDYFHKPIKQALNDVFGAEQIKDIGESCWQLKGTS